MAARPEELTKVLNIAEEAQAINKGEIGHIYDPSPFGWTMQSLDNATELKGFIEGLRYALTMESALADELLKKGAERFVRDRQDAFTQRVSDFQRARD